MAPSKELYFVIGGCGFLGRHIVEALLQRGDSVAVLDIVQKYDDVSFYSGDISDENQVSDALKKSGATCIIHTASPPHGVEDPALYWRVNVEGTKTVIKAAIANNIHKLVYTSSAGVVFNGTGLIDVDERVPAPEKAMDAYNESKLKAEEIVLAANGKDGLLTVALRPAGIFGPGDRQAIVGMLEVLKKGQSHFQIGDNTNIFDWTYVGNVAYAHVLAADKLVPPTEKDVEKTKELLSIALPSINITTGQRRVPTSRARPLGPYVEYPENGDALLAAFNGPLETDRPVMRSRFDPFSDASVDRAEGNVLDVAGQTFFITNGEPVYFWDFVRAVWRTADPEHYPYRKNFVLPMQVGLFFATLLECWGWLTGKEPAFTRFRVTYSCVDRWHNIEKARRALGYEPQVGLEDGLKKTFEWLNSQK